MPSVFKLTENGDEASAEYYASIEGLSAAIYHEFTGYLMDNDIPYESQDISMLVNPKVLLEELNRHSTIYEKYPKNVKIISQGKYGLFVSEYKLNP
jgi:hypothetical protein